MTGLLWVEKTDVNGRTFKQQDGYDTGFMVGPFQNRTIPNGLEVSMFVADGGEETIVVKDSFGKRWYYELAEDCEQLHNWKES